MYVCSRNLKKSQSLISKFITKKQQMYPLKFEPILKQTLWGGDKIIPFKHLNDTLARM